MGLELNVNTVSADCQSYSPLHKKINSSRAYIKRGVLKIDTCFEIKHKPDKTSQPNMLIKIVVPGTNF